MDKTKLKGALLTFLILELVQLFGFLCRVPFSMRRAFDFDFSEYALVSIANFLALLVLFSYCIVCLAAVFQLAVHNPKFLRSFQLSGLIACAGNLVIYVLYQLESSTSYYYVLEDDYWVLFLAALFWISIWSMYFIRSSNVFSYMGEDGVYLQLAFFTKNVNPPEPWKSPARPPFPQPPQMPLGQPPVYPAYPPQPPYYGQPPAQPPVAQAPYPPQGPATLPPQPRP